MHQGAYMHRLRHPVWPARPTSRADPTHSPTHPEAAILHGKKCPHPLTVVEKRFWLGPLSNPLTVVVS